MQSSAEWIGVASRSDFNPEDLPSHGKPSAVDAKTWVLKRLLAGDDPVKHPTRRRYFRRKHGRHESNRWRSSILSRSNPVDRH